jgi:TctA family transporter
MSNGNWAIFFGRPISLVLFGFAAVLLALALVSAIRKRARQARRSGSRRRVTRMSFSAMAGSSSGPRD